jgi:hypothetical protein
MNTAPSARVWGSTKRDLTQACPWPPGLLVARARSGISARVVPSGARGALGLALGWRRTRNMRWYWASSKPASSSKPRKEKELPA